MSAAALLRDGWTVSTSGFTGSGHPEGITAAIEALPQGGTRVMARLPLN